MNLNRLLDHQQLSQEAPEQPIVLPPVIGSSNGGSNMNMNWLPEEWSSTNRQTVSTRAQHCCIVRWAILRLSWVGSTSFVSIRGRGDTPQPADGETLLLRMISCRNIRSPPSHSQ